MCAQRPVRCEGLRDVATSTIGETLPSVSLEKHPGSVSLALCYQVASSQQLVVLPGTSKAAEIYSEPVPETQRLFFFFFLIEVKCM